MEELSAMSPQDQVTRLLEKAINHYKGRRRNLETRGRLDRQIHTNAATRNHDQYRLLLERPSRARCGAREIWLGADNLHKNPQNRWTS
jgi:hypothetical protein